MTNPVPPPTESGWYVVEWIGGISFVDVRHYQLYGKPIIQCLGYHVNELWPEMRVTRYTGPLDLEKLLDEGGER